MSATPIDDDDRPIGRVLSRREALALLGGTGAAIATGAIAGSALAQSASPGTSAAPSAMPSCVVVPELTEGPYWVDERLERSDIRTDSATGTAVAGARLDLAWAVTRIDGTACTPFEGAMVDIWHCDSQGVYSDASDPGFDTQDQDFLRGYQLTDANGSAAFTTIYPGWYSSRAVHIHFKVRTDPDQSTGTVFTSQLFFDDAFTDQVYLAEPYASHGIRTLRNEGDGIFGQSGGQTLLTVTPTADGYAATFAIGVQMG
ncbi:MAG: intradiol ring-cleavage dioxygenase [Chloroflexota bacterium]